MALEAGSGSSERRIDAPGSPNWPTLPTGGHARAGVEPSQASVPISRSIFQRLGLRYSDRRIEAEFQAYFADRVYYLFQATLLLAVAAYALYGIVELSSGTGAVRSTRFRYMVACPALLALYALSFSGAGRKHWQALAVVFGGVASLLTLYSMYLLDQETQFTFAMSSATLIYTLILLFVALAPFPVLLTVGIGLMVQGVHIGALIYFSNFSATVLLGLLLHQSIVFMVVCVIAFWRERLMRNEFSQALSIREEKDAFKAKLLSFVSLDALERLSASRQSVADAYGEVTVLFCDIVGFTQLSEHVAPKHLVELLSDVFSALDEHAERYGVEKVKTIGDAYMAVTGNSDQQPDPTEAMAEFALAALVEARRISDRVGYPITFRIGMNTGSLIGGIVGKQRMAYDYWGRTVNVASRLESGGVPGHIQVSEATYWRLRSKYRLEKRGSMELRGIGAIDTYFLVGRNDGSALGDT